MWLTRKQHLQQDLQDGNDSQLTKEVENRDQIKMLNESILQISTAVKEKDATISILQSSRRATEKQWWRWWILLDGRGREEEKDEGDGFEKDGRVGNVWRDRKHRRNDW